MNFLYCQDGAGLTESENCTSQKAGRVAQSKYEEGADILYDQPSHTVDHMDRESWAPRHVDLSSLWVYEVVSNENIPHSLGGILRALGVGTEDVVPNVAKHVQQ